MLQLSGIGDSGVLEPLGITPMVNLKTVGKNLQDQVSSAYHEYKYLCLLSPSRFQTQTLLFSDGPGYNSTGSGPFTNVIAFPNLHQLYGSSTDSIVKRINRSIPDWAASQASSALSATALEEIYRIQTKPMIEDNG